ncbi:MAG: thioredoxin [Candidatus Paraprevotella stercoravium]|jgi:thioredoxin 1|uniref:Thioredoxin n=2 Tax=Bacteroidales TaxID=171549 RepID=A0ABT7U2N3_9BACE|nr:thioredoxin [Candidatus Paraprevotella stercoravium]MDM8144770.1 thioredoxin [Bacteroides eggerthii]
MESFNDVISSGQLVLVDFYATWCGPCKTMHPVLQELKQRLGDQIRILKIDVDRYQNTAAQYRIQSVPTLMLFRNGQTLWRQSGALPLPALLEQVKAHL